MYLFSLNVKVYLELLAEVATRVVNLRRLVFQTYIFYKLDYIQRMTSFMDNMIEVFFSAVFFFIYIFQIRKTLIQ